MANLPSDITPSFTMDRLQLLASAIVQVRRDALLEHRPEKGDSGWGYGCRCYERACFALEELSKVYPWLRVKRAHLACTLFMEDEPLKFYRGDPDRPNERSVKGAVQEALQQHRLFPDDVLYPDQSELFWLMVIVQEDVDADPQIAVLQVDEAGHALEPFFIAIDEPIPVVTSVSASEAEGVELEPPPVGPRPDTSKEKKDDGSGRNEDGSS